MNAEGIWKIEMLGPHGWEDISTAFMQGGRYFAGSASHYGTGSYEQDGENFKADIRVTQHGEIRTLFGVRNKNVDTRIEGKFETAERIVATGVPTGDGGAFEPGGIKFRVGVLLTRLGGPTE